MQREGGRGKIFFGLGGGGGVEGKTILKSRLSLDFRIHGVEGQGAEVEGKKFFWLRSGGGGGGEKIFNF